MKVLFVSNYVDPYKNYNQNVVEQISYITKQNNINTEILTWPTPSNWSHKIPKEINGYLKIFIKKIKYHLYAFDYKWNTDFNTLSEKDWSEAVKFGEKILKRIKPDIVHMHHRHSMWWIIESAQNINIPTLYTNHDWGIPCLQTNLLMGNGKLCNGITSEIKCSNCVKDGRGTLGRLNEKIVEIKFFSIILNFLYLIFPLLLLKYNILRVSAKERAKIHLVRSKKILNNLNYLITPSKFGKYFFGNFIRDKKKILVLPWPLLYKKTIFPKMKTEKENTIFTYIGRIEKTKGIENFLEALFKIKNQRIIFKIVGKNDSPYCNYLQKKFKNNNGITVKWFEWQEASKFYRTTNFIVIPSIWMDNTPLTLIEALSFDIPVIASNIPTISEYIKNKQLLFNANNISDIEKKIRLCISKKKYYKNFHYKKNFFISNYCKKIGYLYKHLYINQ